MPLYRNKDRAILLVHIPKTGGSSLEEMLVSAGAMQALKFHKRLGFSASTPQHMQWDVLRHWVPKEFYNFSFTIVRNPYARLASEYAWRQAISNTPLPPFNTWICAALKRFKKNPYVLDNHIRPQHEFIGPKVRVFRLEDGLDPVAKIAFRRLGLTYKAPTTPHVRKSQHVVIDIEQSTLEALRAFYAADFETLGYDIDALPEHLFKLVPDPEPEPKFKAPLPPPKSRVRRVAKRIARRIKTIVERGRP